MAAVDARRVDPRDQEWEVWQPVYRVYFWRTGRGGHMSCTREFEASGGDVVEVLSWADQSADSDETYTPYVTVSTPDGLGLIRLAGDDPTRTR